MTIRLQRAAGPKVHEALTVLEEERSWTCDSCPRMVEDGERHCMYCKSYWEDVANGYFLEDGADE